LLSGFFLEKLKFDLIGMKTQTRKRNWKKPELKIYKREDILGKVPSTDEGESPFESKTGS
jgi:hypothetical protein